MTVKKHITRITRNYWKPTPKKWRQIGDSLLAISTMGVPAVLMDHYWIGVSMFTSGIIGKFLTNLFTEKSA